MEDLKAMFEEAKANGWRMSWTAWRILSFDKGWGILDDDSGIDTPDLLLDGRQAEAAFFRCTIGPRHHFRAAV